MKQPIRFGRSVAVIVVAIIVITVSLLLAVASVLAYGYYRDHEQADFARLQETAANQLQTALAPTIWNLDYPQIGKLLESRLLDQHLRAVVLELDDRRLVAVRNPDGQIATGSEVEPAGLLETRRPIDYKGQPLGVLHLYASPELLDAELAQARASLGGFALLLTGVLSLALYLLVARLVVKPLRWVERYAEAISRGDQPAHALDSVDFVGEIDSLKHSIDRMIRELNQRNAELARHRGHLEELVAARTTELEQTVRQLEETQFAMNHAGIAIQWIDADTGRLLYLNERACALYGHDRETLLALPAGQLVPELDPDRLHALLPQLQLEGRATVESDALTSRGPVPVETSIYLQAPRDGHASHFITFTTDISQRKAVERALLAAKAAAEAAARTRSEFLANMSHEIRTPMNAIIGMSQLALNTALDAKQRNYVEKVNQAAVSLLGVLNDILDFSKVEAGRLEIEHVNFRLDDVLANVSNIVGLRAEQKGLDLLIDVATDTPANLIGDPLRIGQVLINLAGNAVKFTDHGSVVVSVRPLPDDADGPLSIEFTVRDTGIGIESAQQAQLFSAFSQGDASISRRFGGTGLGLAISKRLVDLMGGSIGVTSTPGKGSTFRFSVQVQRGTDQPAARNLPAALCGRRILVVDDCSEARDIIAGIIGQFGMQADTASTAAEALAMLARQDYDLLICDWKMPEMDGVQLVRRIQQAPASAAAPSVIMVSAYGIEELRQAAAGLKLAGILPKPASPSTILDVIMGAFEPGKMPQAANRSPTPPDPQRYATLKDVPVLLVEDNALNQELAIELLNSVGVRVTLAENGEQALDRLDTGHFACVLMDVQMPVMDGLEATRRIRQDARFADLPIIAMTAGAMPEERAETRAAGMNAHITKPLNFSELLDTLSAMLGRAPAPVQTPTVSAPHILNTAFGIGIAADNPELYGRLLGHFINGAESRRASLAQAADEGNCERLLAEAHTLRGSAATIGADDTVRCARELERICRESPVPTLLKAPVEALLTADRAACAAIEAYLAATGPDVLAQ